MKSPNYSEWKATVRGLCEFLLLAVGALVAGLGILLSHDAATIANWPSWASWAKPFAEWLKPNSGWILLALTGTAAILKFTKERLEETWVWSTVQEIVDRIRTEAFAQQEGHAHHHRATLFRYKKFRWWPFPVRHWYSWWGEGRGPSSGWLVPVIRSGHTTHKTSTYFLAPDDADNAEGVVGQIWASNKELALSAGGTLETGASQAAINAYAQKTFVSPEWAASELPNKVLAASFRGTPILGRAGRKWGVLILDSRHPTAAKEAKLNIDPYAYCLGKLLERV